jgi:hypothetical protein
MRAVSAFALGATAGSVLAYVVAATIALAVTAAGAELMAGWGPVLFVAVERAEDGTATTFGAGLLLVAVAVGIANSVASTLLARRARGTEGKTAVPEEPVA